MTNSNSLKGKEFIDFLLDFLLAKNSQPEIKLKPGQRMPKCCKNELTKENAEKLGKLFKD